MACFPGRDGLVRLIRNHELSNRPGAMALGVPHAGTPYDALAMGGTITVDFDPAGMRPVREFASLCGTYVNCSGGLAYRDAGWLSCEETLADSRHGFSKRHGYTFMVPTDAEKPVNPVPLKEMGRFVKEAALADADGVVYQTEDAYEAEHRFAYTTVGNTITETRHTDPNGNVTTYRFNGLGYETDITDALGRTTRIERDPATNLVKRRTDPAGRVTQYFYNARGDLIRTVDADNKQTLIDYDARFRKPTRIENALGFVTTMIYDAVVEIRPAKRDSIIYAVDLRLVVLLFLLVLSSVAPNESQGQPRPYVTSAELKKALQTEDTYTVVEALNRAKRSQRSSELMSFLLELMGR